MCMRQGYCRVRPDPSVYLYKPPQGTFISSLSNVFLKIPSVHFLRPSVFFAKNQFLLHFCASILVSSDDFQKFSGFSLSLSKCRLFIHDCTKMKLLYTRQKYQIYLQILYFFCKSVIFQNFLGFCGPVCVLFDLIRKPFPLV